MFPFSNSTISSVKVLPYSHSSFQHQDETIHWTPKFSVLSAFWRLQTGICSYKWAHQSRMGSTAHVTLHTNDCFDAKLQCLAKKDSLCLLSECVSVRLDLNWIQRSQSEFPKIITICFDHFWQFVCLLMCFVSLFSKFSHKLKCDSNFIFISN